jgi:hypothetical protein
MRPGWGLGDSRIARVCRAGGSAESRLTARSAEAPRNRGAPLARGDIEAQASGVTRWLLPPWSLLFVSEASLPPRSSNRGFSGERSEVRCKPG